MKIMLEFDAISRLPLDRVWLCAPKVKPVFLASPFRVLRSDKVFSLNRPVRARLNHHLFSDLDKIARELLHFLYTPTTRVGNTATEAYGFT